MKSHLEIMINVKLTEMFCHPKCTQVIFTEVKLLGRGCLCGWNILGHSTIVEDSK